MVVKGRTEHLTVRQRMLVVVVMLTMTTETIDIAVPGFVYPRLVQQWGVPIAAVTAAVTAGGLALALGGAVAGPIADRVGRRPIPLVGVPLFGAATIGLGFTTSIEAFTALRILAGLGLGAVMPVLLASVAEAAPPSRRGSMVSLAFAGTGIGAILAGVLALWLVPRAGWPALLWVSGAMPLVLLPALALLLPAPRQDETGRIRHPHDHTALELVLGPPMLATTMLIWYCSWVGGLSVFLILNYLPLIVELAHLSAAQAGILVALFGWGGLVGQLVVSFALHRIDRFRLLGALFAVGAAAGWAIALLGTGFGTLAVCVVVLGLTLSGSGGAMYAVGALAYPPPARATGMGLGSSVGRLGGLSSGVAGGLMIGAGWGPAAIFGVLGLPLLAAAAASRALRTRTHRHGSGHADPSTESFDAAGAPDPVDGRRADIR